MKSIIHVAACVLTRLSRRMMLTLRLQRLRTSHHGVLVRSKANLWSELNFTIYASFSLQGPNLNYI